MSLCDLLYCKCGRLQRSTYLNINKHAMVGLYVVTCSSALPTVRRPSSIQSCAYATLNHRVATVRQTTSTIQLHNFGILVKYKMLSTMAVARTWTYTYVGVSEQKSDTLLYLNFPPLRFTDAIFHIVTRYYIIFLLHITVMFGTVNVSSYPFIFFTQTVMTLFQHCIPLSTIIGTDECTASNGGTTYIFSILHILIRFVMMDVVKKCC